jgi:hypothetical protein
MTPRFMAYRSDEPHVCGVCFRQAGNVGTVEPRVMSSTQWMCNLCNAKLGMKVALMNPLKLEKAEAAAFDAAIETNIGDLVGAVMKVLWDNGVRDLDAITGDRFAPMIEKIFEDGEASKVIAKIFLGYANQIRKDMTTTVSDIPF